MAAAAALSACGTEELVSQLNLGKDAAEETETEAEEQSLIDVKGVFYGSYAASQEGYENMYLVFDYVNDLENRTLPSSNEGVTMTINGTNTYNAKMPEYSDNERFEKYTGYEYLIGYGDLLGGADPVRMFVHYEFNPNDLKTGETITFTLGDQTVEYPVADVQEISVMDELLKVEDDYENAQMRAAFKWRVDESVYVFNISRSFFADSSYMLSFSVLCSCVCSRLISPSVSSWHKQDNTLMHQSPGHIQRRTPYNF